MGTSLESPRVKRTLDRLFQDADENDPRVTDKVRDEYERRGPKPDHEKLTGLFGEAYLPVQREVGRLLYMLATGARARLVVEFGTSFGISTIFLAAALRDGGGGKVITTELHPGKVRTARQNIDEAGLGDLVDVREGDALVTLRDVEGPIDLLFLDGWKDLYLPMLKELEPRLRKGAIVVGDDLNIAPDDLRSYVDYVRAEGSGYVSATVPMGDSLEVSAWLGRG